MADGQDTETVPTYEVPDNVELGYRCKPRRLEQNMDNGILFNEEHKKVSAQQLALAQSSTLSKKDALNLVGSGAIPLPTWIDSIGGVSLEAAAMQGKALTLDKKQQHTIAKWMLLNKIFEPKAASALFTKLLVDLGFQLPQLSKSLQYILESGVRKKINLLKSSMIAGQAIVYQEDKKEPIVAPWAVKTILQPGIWDGEFQPPILKDKSRLVKTAYSSIAKFLSQMSEVETASLIEAIAASQLLSSATSEPSSEDEDEGAGSSKEDDEHVAKKTRTLNWQRSTLSLLGSPSFHGNPSAKDPVEEFCLTQDEPDALLGPDILPDPNVDDQEACKYFTLRYLLPI
jgi:hypothetical protein